MVLYLVSVLSQTVVDVIGTHPELSRLASALESVGLDKLLSDTTNNFTVFAPNNPSFAEVFVLNDVSVLLLLEYHVVNEYILSTDLTSAQVINTIIGQKMTAELQDNDAYIVDSNGRKVQIVTADLKAINGVIQIVDSVLLPKVPFDPTINQPTTYYTTTELTNEASLLPNMIKKVGSVCPDGFHDDVIDPKYCVLCPGNTVGREGLCRECPSDQEPNFHHDDCKDKEKPEEWYDGTYFIMVIGIACTICGGITAYICKTCIREFWEYIKARIRDAGGKLADAGQKLADAGRSLSPSFQVTSRFGVNGSNINITDAAAHSDSDSDDIVSNAIIEEEDGNL